jgi:GDPmannose 4,6-dehydratase
MKKALITGITGQDGSYLAELLLSKGYDVIGIVRRSSTSNYDRINHIKHKIKIVEGEVSDSGSVYSIVDKYKPDEIYNLAAQSHVGTSFEQPDYTFQVDALGPTYFLQAIRRYCPDARFYQASTSELFGKNFTEKKRPSRALENVLGSITIDDLEADSVCEFEKYQDEDTAFMPQSPYAAAKLAAHHMVRIYREGYGLHASCGILFNHESERRGENFVTRKITKWIGEFSRWLKEMNLTHENLSDSGELDILFASGRQESFPKLRLGNIDAYRDWGHAKDYVEAMWLMLQRDVPEDLVIATGKTYSVRDFLNEAFNEIGIDDFEPYIVIDPKFYRPSEVEYLKGNPSKAKEVLNWEPKVSFKDLVTQMVRRDINGKEETPLQPVQQEEIQQN